MGGVLQDVRKQHDGQLHSDNRAVRGEGFFVFTPGIPGSLRISWTPLRR